jgi:hypothetical protein
MPVQLVVSVESVRALVIPSPAVKLVAREVPVAAPVPSRDPAPELTDEQLEHVVGGLARVWLERG